MMFNSASTGRSPVLSVCELDELGYSVIVFPLEALIASHLAMQRMLETIASTGLCGIEAPGATFQQLNDFLGMPDQIAWERALTIA